MSHFNRPMKNFAMDIANINYGREIADLTGITMRSLDIRETWWNVQAERWEAICNRCGGAGVLTEDWAIEDGHFVDDNGEHVEVFTNPNGVKGKRCFACPGEMKDEVYYAGRFVLPMPQHFMQAALMTCLRKYKNKQGSEVLKMAKSGIDMARDNQWGWQKEIHDFWQMIGRRADRRAKSGKFLSAEDLMIPWIRQATLGNMKGAEHVARLMVNGWDMHAAKVLVGIFGSYRKEVLDA